MSKDRSAYFKEYGKRPEVIARRRAYYKTYWPAYEAKPENRFRKKLRHLKYSREEINQLMAQFAELQQ